LEEEWRTMKLKAETKMREREREAGERASEGVAVKEERRATHRDGGVSVDANGRWWRMGSGGARQPQALQFIYGVVEIDDRHGNEASKLVLRDRDLFVSTLSAHHSSDLDTMAYRSSFVFLKLRVSPPAVEMV
jgi:hypothetical protein